MILVPRDPVKQKSAGLSFIEYPKLCLAILMGSSSLLTCLKLWNHVVCLTSDNTATVSQAWNRAEAVWLWVKGIWFGLPSVNSEIRCHVCWCRLPLASEVFLLLSPKMPCKRHWDKSLEEAVLLLMRLWTGDFKTPSFNLFKLSERNNKPINQFAVAGRTWGIVNTSYITKLNYLGCSFLLTAERIILIFWLGTD